MSQDLPVRSQSETEPPLGVVKLHHVSLVTRDLPRAAAFYEGVLGLRPIARPPFPIGGVWLSAGALELHLTAHPEGTFRDGAGVDANDVHFAIRVEDFEAALRRLAGHGLQEGRAVVVRRGSMAGYHQAYLTDPDGHVIEINAEM